MKSQSYNIFIPCLLSLALLNACTSSDSDSTTPTTDDSQGAEVADKYIGSYASVCREIGSLLTGEPTSQNVFHTFTADTRTEVVTIYNGTDCINPSMTSTSVFSVTYPGDTTSTNLGEADNLDETFVSSEVDGSFTNVSQFVGIRYKTILLDGINLYISEAAGATPAERPDFLFEDMVFVRQ